MKTAFFETNSEDENRLKAMLAEAAEIEPIFFSHPLGETDFSQIAGIEALCVFIYSKIDKKTIDKLPKLKLIAARSTGFDHIDAEYCKQKNISVCNVPSYGSRTVAEFTFALILGLSRKTFLAYHQVKENHDFDFSHFEGFNLQGKTIGIIGTGRIGLNVAQIAKGFEMRILGFEPKPKAEIAEQYQIKYVSLDELLANSDIITVHVPYMPATRHLINKDNINKIKKGALLINTARGEVVQTESLLLALKDGSLGGVGLDVLEGEKNLKEEWQLLTSGQMDQNVKELKVLLEEHMLIDDPRVAITPHIAFFSQEAKREILQTTADNILKFLSGVPQNVV